jgi:aspartyl-tRNA(Asn)/glutamyl-tRNA(Gln) amidotransferase subunit A
VEPVTLAHPGKLRIAYYREGLERAGMDPEVVAHLQGHIERLRAEGHTVEPMDVPLLDHQVPTYYILATAEASSNLARFDGIRYGHRSKAAKGVDETYRLSRTEGFRTRGETPHPPGHLRAQRGLLRRLLRPGPARAPHHRDTHLGGHQPIRPAAGSYLPHHGLRPGEVTDPVAMYLQDIFTVQANLAGVPAISLPTGTHPNGLPFGIQLTAAPFAEAKLLAAAEHLF